MENAGLRQRSSGSSDEHGAGEERLLQASAKRTDASFFYWLALLVSSVGALVMFGVIAWAASSADQAKQLAALLSLPWGVVSLVDLYVGFALFSLWILFRDGFTVWSCAWVVAMQTLGFFAGSVYVLLQLRRSRGDWEAFWLGGAARQRGGGRAQGA